MVKRIVKTLRTSLVYAGLLAIILGFTDGLVLAQTTAPAAPPAAPAENPPQAQGGSAAPSASPAPAPAASAASPAAAALTEGQIEQLVAPIALYPDSLLSQILMASTYPLEVVEAARWSKENASVKGKALEDAMQKQSWDPSVKALAAIPQTLQMMNDKLDWTQQLGDAFLAQQQDVMAAVQTLRARADAAGNLKSTSQQKVTKSAPPAGVTPPAGMQQAITIDPVDPDTYYVPVYDPGVVYGAWDYPAYQPFYWYPPGYVAAGVIGFTAGVAVGAAIWGRCDWWRRDVNINVNRFNQFNRTNIVNGGWAHNPAHRGGVAYHNANVAARFGSGNTAAARQALKGGGNPGQRNFSNAGRGAKTGPKNAAARGGGNRPANVSRAKGGKQVSHARSGAGHHAARTRPNVSRPGGGTRPNISRGGGGQRMHAGGGMRGGGGAMRGGGGRGGGGFHGGGGRRR
ncbi:DUF3300 domain-containing protein [Bradyrhizobium sp. F1.4.3]|uniref:DUF3300 domain-containing protein n=1 Tax=Bradyrhizobium sp. F1.4.3 TaxID=3156356 RepID=UPI003396F608